MHSKLVVSLLMVALSFMGIIKVQASNTTNNLTFTDPKHPNTHTIACNSCDDKQKLAKVKQIVNGKFEAGDFKFVVVDVLNSNVREYSVYVPVRSQKDVAEQLLPATVTKNHIENQAERDKEIEQLKQLTYEVNEIPAKAFGGKTLTKEQSFNMWELNIQLEKGYELGRSIEGVEREIQTLYIMPASLAYKNIHQVISEFDDFESYLNHYFKRTYHVAIRQEQDKPILYLKTRKPSDEVQDIQVNPKAIHQMVFSDGSSLEIQLKLVHQSGVGVAVMVSSVKRAKDKSGKPIPLDAFG